LQTSLSPQLVPLATAALITPSVGSQESAVQGLPSLTTGGVPGLHVPASQVSEPLHRSLSAQLVPFDTFECRTPCTGSHESAVQGLLSLVASGVPGAQVPAWQVSAPLQTVLSGQAVPSGLLGFEHWPFVGLHVPALWHWSLATQVMGVPATQVPVALHVSAPLQRLLSAQLVPAATFV
jgi:hypothetical protein